MSSKKDAKSLWLAEGLKILEAKGPVMLSIETLTSRTKKTKGSFYHHFSSREQYIKDLLEYYEKITTNEIIQITSDENDAQASLKKLTELTFQLSSRLELAIRAWALYDKTVKKFQDNLDHRRVEYLKQLHEASGMDADSAWARAYRDYSLFIGLQQIRHHHNETDFRRLMNFIYGRR